MEPHEDHPELTELAAKGQVVAYFGYGSLVNRRTLRTQFLGIRRAEVVGWRRLWLPRGTDEKMALLSVEPAADAVLHGVVVYDLLEHLPMVDEREKGYDRRDVDPGALTIDRSALDDVTVHIYEARRAAGAVAGTGPAILQSYLDAVMQGFRAIYGEEGLGRFVRETKGFETDILRDRTLPRYPRPVALEEGEAAMFDAMLIERGARFVDF